MIEPSVNDPDESGSDDEIRKFVSNVGEFAKIINDQYAMEPQIYKKGHGSGKQ